MTDAKTEKRRAFIINAAYWAVILLLCYIFFKHILGRLAAPLIGLIAARLLNPLVKFISKKTRVPKKAVAFILVFLFTAVIGLLAVLLVTRIVAAVREQVSLLPGYYYNSMLPSLQQLESWLMENMGDFFPSWDVTDGASNIVASLTDTIMSNLSAFGQVAGWTAQAPGVLLRVMFTFLFALFGSIYYEEAGAFILRQLPGRMRDLVPEVLSGFKRAVVSYYGAYLKIMAVTFAEMLVGLSIVRGQFSPLPALGIALLDLIPVVGSGTVMVPWVIIHLIIGNYPLAAGLAVVYLVTLVVRPLIEPKIVGDQLGLNPLLALASIYIGFIALGFLGMILLPIVVTLAAEMQREGRLRILK